MKIQQVHIMDVLGLLRSAYLHVSLCSLTLAGCLQGAPVTAVGPCSQALGAPVVLNLSPSVTANLGTDAVEAASKAALSYLVNIPGPLNINEQDRATSLAVDAAESRIGKPLPRESREAINEEIRRIASHKFRCEIK